MLRPYFGQRATLAVGEVPVSNAKAYALGRTIVVEPSTPSPIIVFNTLGQVVYKASTALPNAKVEIRNLKPGLYLVKVGAEAPHKIVVY